MAGLLDGVEIEIGCECGRKSKKSIGWIKRHSKFTCACGMVILLDANQFRGEISKVDRGIADLQKQLKQLGK